MNGYMMGISIALAMNPVRAPEIYAYVVPEKGYVSDPADATVPGKLGYGFS